LEQKNNSKEILEQIQALQSAINDIILNIELKKLQEKMEELKGKL
jgi:DNA-binding FrmR family transcriptional regulator